MNEVDYREDDRNGADPPADDDRDGADFSDDDQGGADFPEKPLKNDHARWLDDSFIIDVIYEEVKQGETFVGHTQENTTNHETGEVQTWVRTKHFTRDDPYKN